jgi:hypothetical protein
MGANRGTPQAGPNNPISATDTIPERSPIRFISGSPFHPLTQIMTVGPMRAVACRQVKLLPNLAQSASVVQSGQHTPTPMSPSMQSMLPNSSPHSTSWLQTTVHQAM